VPSSILVLGIDPGTLTTGYGVIEQAGAGFHRITSGCIHTSPKDKLPIRLQIIYAGLIEIIDQFHPDECSIETAFFGKNIQSTLKLGQARGVSILAAVHRQLAIEEYSPREIKRSVTGTGAASKKQVAYMVCTLLGLEQDILQHDETDALATAICHAQHMNSGRSAKDWASFVAEHPERVRGGR